jgi:hypothetical protein
MAVLLAGATCASIELVDSSKHPASAIALNHFDLDG